MKMTLLEMVQNILSAMESDEVITIEGTAESSMIAEVLREVYFQLVANQTIPEHQTIFQLTDAGATAKVFMLIPTTINKVNWIKYNKRTVDDTDDAFQNVTYLEPETFINRLLQAKSSDTTTVSATDPTSSIVLDMIQNDQPPQYWTSFDDEYIAFDSYDVAVDASGLVASKTLCWGNKIPTWTHNDVFIPDMDENFFPLLLAEAKSLCFVNMKQMPNAKVERQARNQKVYLQNDKYRTRQAQEASTSPTGPDYGRRRR